MFADSLMLMILSFRSLRSILIVAFVGVGALRAGDPPSLAIATKDIFKVPLGADPGVPDSLGGAGFERIAAERGWETGAISEEQFRLVADTNAKKGGSISFALQEYPSTLRTMGKDANSDVTSFITGNIYEPLITTNPMTLEFLPVLATHWKIDADKQTFYYRINPNARFSDGHPVTSEDVIATYRLGSDSTILDPFQNSFNAEFDPPVAVSKYIVKIRSKELNWKNFLYFGGQSVLPAHIIGRMNGTEYLRRFKYAMPPGSGPYIVRQEDVRDWKSLALTRRSNWWGKDDPQNRGQNNFDKIKIAIIADPWVALERFKKGEIDVFFVAGAQWWRDEFDFAEVRRGLVQKRKVYTDEPVGVSGFAFNTRAWPFDDERVREAFLLLFNRDQFVDTALHDEYRLMDSYYANTEYANPNNPRYRFDPDRAVQLLAEAGYTQRDSSGFFLVKDDRIFVVNVPITEAEEQIMVPVQEEMFKVGIGLNLIVVDGATKFRLLTHHDFSVAYQAWTGLLYPNPIGSWSSKTADLLGTTNITGFKNPVVDQLIEREQQTFDQKERVKILRTIDSILISSKHYALSWYAPCTRVAYWNKFGQPDFYAGRISDWKSVFGLWWYDPERAAKVERGEQMEVGETDVEFWKSLKVR